MTYYGAAANFRHLAYVKFCRNSVYQNFTTGRLLAYLLKNRSWTFLRQSRVLCCHTFSSQLLLLSVASRYRYHHQQPHSFNDNGRRRTDDSHVDDHYGIIEMSRFSRRRHATCYQLLLKQLQPLLHCRSSTASDASGHSRRRPPAQ